MSRETVDGQKIAPLHHWFFVCMLELAFQDHVAKPQQPPPPSPPVFNVVTFGSFFFIVLVLDHLISASPFNIKFGRAGGSWRHVGCFLVVVLVCFGDAIFCRSTVLTLSLTLLLALLLTLVHCIHPMIQNIILPQIGLEIVS